MFMEKKSGKARPDAGRLEADSLSLPFPPFLFRYLIPF